MLKVVLHARYVKRIYFEQYKKKRVKMTKLSNVLSSQLQMPAAILSFQCTRGKDDRKNKRVTWKLSLDAILWEKLCKVEFLCACPWNNYIKLETSLERITYLWIRPPILNQGSDYTRLEGGKRKCQSIWYPICRNYL